MITLQDANNILHAGYPSTEKLKKFPFARYLEKVWEHDEGYDEHGPAVLRAINHLLSDRPERMLKGEVQSQQKETLRRARDRILHQVFSDWPFEDTCALLRVAALYHDIGKYIIKDRHPIVGWHIVQDLDPEEKQNLRTTMGSNEYFAFLTLIIRDHDQFGVICTGEASYPILLRAARSLGDAVEDRKRILSALMIFNLADMAGVFDVDGETVTKVAADWEWAMNAVSKCANERQRLSEYFITEASRVSHTRERIRRLLAEASRKWPRRRKELDDAQFVREKVATVFGNEAASQTFASQFTRICKLDYGKRFFEALMEYCEGPPETRKDKEARQLPTWAPERISREDVFYAVLAILRRITNDYAGMAERTGGVGNLLGVEMKDLTPKGAPEKTARIIELLVKSHYPGLTWLMNDVPAWHF